MAEKLSRVPALWTDDCQGKKDYDGSLVTLSTRYWPRGGGFLVFDTESEAWEDNEDRPEIKPSAHSTIYLGSTGNEFYDEAVPLFEAEFEADTEDEVKHQVEVWAASQFRLIVDILLKELKPQD